MTEPTLEPTLESLQLIDSSQSAYDMTVTFDPKASHHPILELGICHGGAVAYPDLLIKSKDSKPLYYVESTTFSKDGNDMLVRDGKSRSGSIIGACRFKALSTDITILEGNPIDTKAEWKTLSAKSALSANFSFIVVMASGTPEVFEWRRSHGKDVQSVGGKWFSMRNMTLVRLANEKTYGVYVDNLFKAWSKIGKIQFRETDELGAAGEFTALLAVLSINEKTRRHLRGTAGYQAGGKWPI